MRFNHYRWPTRDLTGYTGALIDLHLQRDWVGQRIGPEPTTDRFTAIMSGTADERLIPGHALAMQSDRPFQALASFGNNFLTKFDGAEINGR